MFRKKTNKLVKVTVVGALLLALSGCQLLAFTPMLMYGASLEVDRKLEGFEIWRELKAMERSGEIEKIDKTDTRVGIDRDGNGIRDDVDDFVEAKAKTELELLALQNMAKGYQDIQKYETLSVDAFDEYNKKVGGARSCLSEMRSIDEAFYISKSIDKLTANTSKRKDRREDFEELPIYVISLVPCNVPDWNEIRTKQEEEKRKQRREDIYQEFGIRGPDKNNDGIRDDIYPFLKRWGKTPEMKESLELMAQGIQEIQAAETVNIDLYKSFHEKVSRAKSCLEEQDGLTSRVIEYYYKHLEKWTANRDERKKRRAEVDALPISKELLEKKYPCN